MITGTGYTLTGLKNGTTYYVTADAVNDANLHSAASAEASATPAAPVTAPGAPCRADRDRRRRPGEPVVAGAGLRLAARRSPATTSTREPAASITGKPVASAKGTGATIKNLTNGTTFFFKVTAVNKAGEGSASGAASATPAAAITNPGPPNGLTASPGNGQVTLSWAAPASDGGASISGYEIYRGTRPGGESGGPVNGTLVQATSFTMTGLTNGTTYYFTVAAVNTANRHGGASGEASATPVSATSPASPASPASSASRPGGTGAAGAPGAPTGASAGASAGPTGTAVLASTSKKVPKPVIVSLAAVAVGATAGALALTARRLRKRPRSRPPLAPAVGRAGRARQGPARPGEHP